MSIKEDAKKLADAIYIAYQNGYSHWIISHILDEESCTIEYRLKDLVLNCELWIEDGTAYQIIFSHEFAKARWGKKKITEILCWGCNTGEVQRHHTPCQCLFEIAWKYHLQHMVLEEDPFSYL